MRLDEESSGRDKPASKLAGLAHERLGDMSDVQQARGMSGVLAAFDKIHRVPRGRRVRLMALAGAAVALALLGTGAIVGAKLLHREPLTFAMSGGEIQAGGYFRVDDHAQPIIRFSDGTRLALKPGARGRVASVDAVGARVILDDGEAHVAVVPRSGAQWLFDAGPFLVHVHGTEFDLAWNPDEGKLDVRLQTGAVSVDGPLSNQAVSLRGGQWLTVRLAAHEVFVRNLDSNPAPTAAEPPSAPKAAVTETLLPDAPVVAGRPTRSHPARPEALDWARARAEGSWDRILDAATKRGIDRTLAERGSEDLALLADAAHYLHQDSLAERALLAQRKRFAGSTRARDAAFLLGRIVETRPGGSREALQWYDRHLEEAPRGVYASEALGRKMTVLGRLGGEPAARPVAEEYLRRYPAGTYARAAQAYAKAP